MSSEFSNWSKKNQRRVIWILIVGVVAVWLFGMGGLGDLGCWSGIAECAARWTDQHGEVHVRKAINIGSPPVKMLEVSAGDIVKIHCSGSSSIFLGRVTTGSGRESTGCYGIENSAPTKVKERADKLGYEFPLRGVWPQPNVPMLAAICRPVPYSTSFTQENQWLRSKWEWINYRGFWQQMKEGKDTHDSLRMMTDGYLYCWANAPVDDRVGKPKGSYWFEVKN